MWIALIVMIFGGLVSVLTSLVNPVAELPSKNIAQYGVTMQYEIFIQTAKAYMGLNPSATGTLYWSTISGGLSQVTQTTPIPSTWYLKILGSGAWVACTPMDNISIQYILPRADPNAMPFVKGSTLATSNSTANGNGYSSNC